MSLVIRGTIALSGEEIEVVVDQPLLPGRHPRGITPAEEEKKIQSACDKVARKLIAARVA